MPRHAIHLGNAWEPAAADGRWLRRFGMPSGTVAGDRVVLVLERDVAGVPWRRLLLNDVEVTLTGAGVEAGRHECDVTTLLRDRNELVVVPDAAIAGVPDGPPGRRRFPEAWGRVSVEIVTSG